MESSYVLTVKAGQPPSGQTLRGPSIVNKGMVNFYDTLAVLLYVLKLAAAS